MVLPYIEPETIMEADLGVLKTLLTVYYPLCAAFKDPFKSKFEGLGELLISYSNVCDGRLMDTSEGGSQIIRLAPGDWDGIMRVNGNA